MMSPSSQFLWRIFQGSKNNMAGFGTCSDHRITDVQKLAPIIISGTNICPGNNITWYITDGELTSAPAERWHCLNQQCLLGENLLIWTWSKCLLVEAHLVSSHPCVGAGNRERLSHRQKESMLQCHHIPVLPLLPKGLDMCSSNECELNGCRKQRSPHLPCWEGHFKEASPQGENWSQKKVARIFLFLNTHPGCLFMSLHLYISTFLYIHTHLGFFSHHPSFHPSQPPCLLVLPQE